MPRFALVSILCCMLFFAGAIKLVHAATSSDLKVTTVVDPDTTVLVTHSINIIVENLGPDNATGVFVRDTIYSSGPFSFDILSDWWSDRLTTTANVVQTIGTLMTVEFYLGSSLEVKNVSAVPSGGQAAGQWTIWLYVHPASPGSQDIYNEVDVASNSTGWTDPDMSNNQAQASIHVTAVADLTLMKMPPASPVYTGDTLTYTLTVANLGPSTADNVLVKDWLPEGVSVNSIAVSAGHFEVGVPGDPFRPTTWAVGSLAVLHGETMTINATVLNSTDLSKTTWLLHNDACVSSDTLDPDNSNNLASVHTTVVSTFVQERTDLNVMMFVKPDTTVLAGQLINYTIIVENLGPSYAYKVGMRDEILSSGTFEVLACGLDPNRGSQIAMAYPRDSWGGQTFEFNLTDPLEPKNASFGGRWMVHITLRANETQDINSVVNVFTRTSRTLDPDLSNNQAETSIHVDAAADLSLQKTATPSYLPYPQKALAYMLTVTNNGPSTATNVIIRDWLPVEVLSINSITSTKGSCNCGVPGDPSRPTLCTVGTLMPGESMTVSIAVTLSSSNARVHNDASVSSDEFDPDNSNNIASVITLAGSGPPAKSSIADPTSIIAIALIASIALVSSVIAMRRKKIDLLLLIRKSINSLKKTNTT
jgi:uncharacterized repeat protein (TIGR01451 family)